MSAPDLLPAATDEGGPPAVVSPFAALNVRALTERLCGIEAGLDAGGRIGAALRAELRARAIARWREDGAAPTFRAPGLGTVTLPVPQTRVVVRDAAAFCSWTAQRHPTEVETSVGFAGIDAGDLPAILEGVTGLIDRLTAQGAGTLEVLTTLTHTEIDALGALLGGGRLVTEQTVRGPWSKVFLDRRVNVADVEDADGTVTARAWSPEGELVDGLVVIRGADPEREDGPQPGNVSVKLDPDAKEQARRVAERELSHLAGGFELPAATLAGVVELHSSQPWAAPDADVAGDLSRAAAIEVAKAEEEHAEQADAEPDYDGPTDGAPSPSGLDTPPAQATRGPRPGNPGPPPGQPTGRAGLRFAEPMPVAAPASAEPLEPGAVARVGPGLVMCPREEAHDPHWHTIVADGIVVAGGQCIGAPRAAAEPSAVDEPSPQLPDALGADSRWKPDGWRGMHKAELQGQCRLAELDPEGTVPVLLGRLREFVATQGAPT